MTSTLFDLKRELAAHLRLKQIATSFGVGQPLPELASSTLVERADGVVQGGAARGDVAWTPDRRTSRRNAAQYLGIAPGTLANLTSSGRGPPLIKKGSKVWYFQKDLDAWLEQGRVISTAQANALAASAFFPNSKDRSKP